MNEIKEVINCQQPTLEVGKKYTFDIYDMDRYEGDTVDHKLVDTRYITYEGGDIANCFMLLGRRYSFNDVMFMQGKWADLGDYIHEVRNVKRTDNHHHADLIFEMYTTKHPVRAFDAETMDEPWYRIELALHISEYKEPTFINL